MPFPGKPNDEQETECLDAGDEDVVGIGRHAAPDIGDGDDARDDIDPAVDDVLQHTRQNNHGNANLPHNRADQHQLGDRSSSAGCCPGRFFRRAGDEQREDVRLQHVDHDRDPQGGEEGFRFDLFCGGCAWIHFFSLFRKVGLDWNNRDEGHTDIPHLFEQSVQGGLVPHRTGKKGVAVLFRRDGQAVEPCRPLGVQMSLEADFIELII